MTQVAPADWQAVCAAALPRRAAGDEDLLLGGALGVPLGLALGIAYAFRRRVR